MQQLPEKQHALPRICIISSGQEKNKEGTHLSSLFESIPDDANCMVQIREKHLDGLALYNLACLARKKRGTKKVLLLLNERADIAFVSGLDGVHLPEKACSPAALKEGGLEMLFGCSVHSLQSAIEAERSGADYLLFGPVFDTPSKRRYGPPQGIEKLKQVCRLTHLPVYALGGITMETAPFCREMGAYGCAALSLFLDSTLLAGTLEQLNLIWQK